MQSIFYNKFSGGVVYWNGANGRLSDSNFTDNILYGTDYAVKIVV